nr:hypothetical protein [Wilkie qin-like virus]
MATANLPVLQLNGVAEFGLSAGVDPGILPEHRLRLVPRAQLLTTPMEVQFAHAMASVVRVPPPGSLARSLLIAGVYQILVGRWHGIWPDVPVGHRTIDGVVEATVVPANIVTDEIIAMCEELNAMTPDEHSNAALLVLSTKVNYWLINHHTGQGAPQSFARKVIDRLEDGPVTADSEIAAIAYRLGHAVDSRLVLNDWLHRIYPDMPVRNPYPNAPAGYFSIPIPTRDVTVRLSSLPAGCGKLTFVREVLRRAAASPYAGFFTCGDFVASFMQQYERVSTTPWLAHVGCRWLTDLPPMDIIEPDELLMAECVVFINATSPNGSLSKSQSAMKIADAEAYAGTTSARIRAFRAQLLAYRPNDAAVRRILDRMMVVATHNPLAAAATAGTAFVYGNDDDDDGSEA